MTPPMRVALVFALPGTGTRLHSLEVEYQESYGMMAASRKGAALLKDVQLSCSPSALVMDRANQLSYYTESPNLYEFAPKSDQDGPAITLNSTAKYRSCFWDPYSGRLFAGYADSGRVDVYGKPKDGSRKKSYLHTHSFGGSEWTSGIRDLAIARVQTDEGTVTVLCALSEHLREGKRQLHVGTLADLVSAADVAPTEDEQTFNVPADTRFLAVAPWQSVLLVSGGKEGIQWLDLKSRTKMLTVKEPKAVTGRPAFLVTYYDRGQAYAYTTDSGDVVTRQLSPPQSGAQETLETPESYAPAGAAGNVPSLLADSTDMLWSFVDGGPDDNGAFVSIPTVGALIWSESLGISAQQRVAKSFAGGTHVSGPLRNTFAFRGSNGEPLVYVGSQPNVRRILQDQDTGKPVEQWTKDGITYTYAFREAALPYRDLWGPTAFALNTRPDTSGGAFVRQENGKDKVHFLVGGNYYWRMITFNPNTMEEPTIANATTLNSKIADKNFYLSCCCDVDNDMVLLLGAVETGDHNTPSWWLWNADSDTMVGEPQKIPDSVWAVAAFRGYDTLTDPTAKASRRVLRLYDDAGSETAWTIGRDSGGAYKVTVHKNAQKFLAAAAPTGAW